MNQRGTRRSSMPGVRRALVQGGHGVHQANDLVVTEGPRQLRRLGGQVADALDRILADDGDGDGPVQHGPQTSYFVTRRLVRDLARTPPAPLDDLEHRQVSHLANVELAQDAADALADVVDVVRRRPAFEVRKVGFQDARQERLSACRTSIASPASIALGDDPCLLALGRLAV
ncbi:MAG: hypothetical protein GY711_24485 [bacterium]|nr:hypothetical protein [bacterium]